MIPDERWRGGTKWPLYYHCAMRTSAASRQTSASVRFFQENLSVAQRMAVYGRGQDDLSFYFTARLQGRRRAFLIMDAHYLPAGGAMALELAVISAVAGAVLGLRYKVLILVPAVMFAVMFAVVVGVARAESVLSVVLLTAAVGAAVQIGYLAGIVMRAVLEWICALLIRNRSLGLGSLGVLWPHAWQLNTGGAPDAVARTRPPRPPQG
jgi:hypothetical protein